MLSNDSHLAGIFFLGGSGDLRNLTFISDNKGCFQLTVCSKHHQQLYIYKCTYDRMSRNNLIHFSLKPKNYESLTRIKLRDFYESFYNEEVFSTECLSIQSLFVRSFLLFEWP